MIKNSANLLILGLLLLLGNSACAPKVKNGYTKERGFEGNISLSGAFALYPLAVLWSEDFKKEHPHVRFNISAGGAGKGIADALTGMVDIGLVSRDLHPEEMKNGAFPIHVAKDAVICTINANNPNFTLLKERGLTKDELKNIFIHNKYKTWKEIDSRFTNDPIIVYIRADAAGAAETWANFFKSKQEDLKGIGIFGDPGIAQAVKDDKNAIGFNNINYVYDLKTKKVASKIDVLPIDLNQNGKITEDENFYRTINELTAAIGNSTYPSPPARDLTFVTKGKPDNLLINEFIHFVLKKKSQSYLLENGYVPLNDLLIEKESNKL
ncbi:substrate-binding domain-containing protein [Sphingobacterium sp. SRCM116780]|uniref:PstS family phosphate ABC transporter substrate-binding protein n=1 Tax=Sphingobacterium sp. SRCM116780 TaxID=2907623 RepID=UPI001F43D8FF|nr:substrate-binding domain-containing protein [Sphingobacterium sp. SRCM116780]UIR57569.1 substrate-binding domain-containing protein [Sphingobacterium sp. SRCM116780]